MAQYAFFVPQKMASAALCGAWLFSAKLFGQCCVLCSDYYRIGFRHRFCVAAKWTCGRVEIHTVENLVLDMAVLLAVLCYVAIVAGLMHLPLGLSANNHAWVIYVFATIGKMSASYWRFLLVPLPLLIFPTAFPFVFYYMERVLRKLVI